MSFVKQNTSTFVINNQTITDGSFITLNIGDIYINSSNYTYSPNLTTQLPVWSYTNHQVVSAATAIQDIAAVFVPGDHMDSAPAQIGYYDGTNYIGSDVIASAQYSTVGREYRNFNGATPPPHTSLDPPQTDTFSTLNTVSSNNQVQLCVEIHGTFIVFRGLNGLYMHLLPSETVKNTTYSGYIETNSDYVLTFTNLPSCLHSAQWSLYSQTNTNNVILQNRATTTCLTLSNSVLDTASSVWQWTGSGPYNWVYEIGYTWYPNDTTQECVFKDTYQQSIYRVLGGNTLATATQSSRSIFTLQLITQQECSLLNPNSFCLSKYTTPGVATAFQALCSVGDMMSTANCQAWALGNGIDDAQAIVATYAAKYPNDITFAGCVNLWPTRELQDLLSYNSPPISLNPNCNTVNCKPNVSYRSPSLIANTCVQQICNQALIVLGSVVSSSVAFSATCTSAVSGATTTVNVLSELIAEIQTYLSGVYTEIVSKVSLISILTTVLIFIVSFIIFWKIFKHKIAIVLPFSAIASAVGFQLIFNR